MAVMGIGDGARGCAGSTPRLAPAGLGQHTPNYGLPAWEAASALTSFRTDADRAGLGGAVVIDSDALVGSGPGTGQCLNNAGRALPHRGGACGELGSPEGRTMRTRWRRRRSLARGNQDQDRAETQNQNQNHNQNLARQ